jgi:hypothetical protein
MVSNDLLLAGQIKEPLAAHGLSRKRDKHGAVHLAWLQIAPWKSPNISRHSDNAVICQPKRCTSSS